MDKFYTALQDYERNCYSPDKCKKEGECIPVKDQDGIVCTIVMDQYMKERVI